MIIMTTLRMRRPFSRAGRHRPAATTLEFAIILVLFLLLMLGMIDLGMALFQNQQLAAAARHGARQAIVHGKLTGQVRPTWNGGAWGPATIDVLGSSTDHPIVEAIRPFLVQIDPARTKILVEWPEGSNDLKTPVRVTVRTTYRPMITYIFGAREIALSASSTLPIAH